MAIDWTERDGAARAAGRDMVAELSGPELAAYQAEQRAWLETPDGERLKSRAAAVLAARGTPAA